MAAVTTQHHLPYKASEPAANGYGNSSGNYGHGGGVDAYGYHTNNEYDQSTYRPPPPPRQPQSGSHFDQTYPSSSSGRQGPPPPAYQRVTRRWNGVSLRPVLLFTTFISILYLFFISITSLRQINQRGNSTRLTAFNAIIGILLLLAALVEILGFTAAWTCRLPLARLYARGSTVALGAVIGAQVTGLVEHYVAKSDLIDGCTTRNTGATAISSSGWSIWGTTSATVDGTPLTATEAREYCQARWDRQGIWLIVWLVIVLFLGVVLVMLAFSFLRQLNDPSSVLRSNNRRGGAANAPYSAAFNYDESETSPFDNTGGASNGPYAYPPPPHAPPLGGERVRGVPSQATGGGFSATSSDAPEYVADDPNGGGKPRKSMQSIDLDRKDSMRDFNGEASGAYEYEYTLGYASGGGDGARGRPESSRSVRRVGDDEGRRSDETLRGDEQEGAAGSGRAGGAKV